MYTLEKKLVYQEEENGMRSFDFLRKNKKVVVMVGLLLVCVSIRFRLVQSGKMLLIHLPNRRQNNHRNRKQSRYRNL